MTLFYSICFTLPGAQPRKNTYIHCLMLLFKSLLASGSLQNGDSFIVVCDPETAKYLKEIPFFKGIALAVVPTPKSVKEGMTLKYVLRPQKDDVVVYLDSDLLARRPIRPVLDPDTLCVFPEGRPDDTNYCGEGCPPLLLGAGFTAGFFAYRPGKRVYAFFDAILADIKAGAETFYSLDQPYFNRHISSSRVQVFPRSYISFNGNTNLADCTLINFAGDPGDGEFHLTKMLQTYLMLPDLSVSQKIPARLVPSHPRTPPDDVLETH